MNQRCPFYPVSAVVGQVQLRLLRTEVDSGFLAHHLGVDGLVGLNADHQLVPPALRVKDVSRNVGELQPHLCLPLIQSLSTPKDEGNPWRERAMKYQHIQEENQKINLVQINAVLLNFGFFRIF